MHLVAAMPSHILTVMELRGLGAGDVFRMRRAIGDAG
jgi:hypothetical protein